MRVLVAILVLLVVGQAAALSRAASSKVEKFRKANRLVEEALKYNGAEHQYLGNQAWAVATKAAGIGEELTLGVTGKEFNVKFGDVVGLAGDFFSDKTKAVCREANGPAEFRSQFSKLADSDGTIVKKIKELFLKERTTIQQFLSQGKTPLAAYTSLGVTHDTVDLDQASGGNYLDYAKNNYDHFSPCAETAYRTGHAVAVATAVSAAIDKKAGKPYLPKLARAYAMEAFSCHYLSDLFASGHMRVPRIELSKFCSVDAVAGIMAKCQHDEDNNNGLKVKNKFESWTAFGDANFDDAKNAKNREVATKALRISIEEVTQAFNVGGQAPAFAAFDYIPQLTSDNAAPMFKMDGKVLKVRTGSTYQEVKSCIVSGLKCRFSAPSVQKVMEKLETDLCAGAVLPAAAKLVESLGSFGSTLINNAAKFGYDQLKNNVCGRI